MALGDDVSTDHISPVSPIPRESVAGRWLTERGVRDFDSYRSRRGDQFDIGERLYDGMDPRPSEKYLAISDFKAGFGGAVLARLDVVGGSM